MTNTNDLHIEDEIDRYLIPLTIYIPEEWFMICWLIPWIPNQIFYTGKKYSKGI